ncbi:glycoside hydrolase superfamily [Aspergillus cavernicola]|uniref:beta-glucosidase n=1 Tax=Aspergillus cavernicola TaxID=176166 RepID=A0ABR4I6Q2_9EURO
MSGITTATLLSSLTLEEKLSLIAGESQWRTATIKRLGIPALKVSDGPSGARGEIFRENVPAAFFPSGASLGATWDEFLTFEVGQLLAEEVRCKSKSASVSLAPTMCIHRHPLGGRNFESFSEDPYLTGKLAAAHIRGLQFRGVAATAKHFPMIRKHEADPWCMMTAYNKVNGHHCAASKELLINIARKEWKWDSVFMSDLGGGGTNSTMESINNGLDLEMPGPPIKRSIAALDRPLREGLVDLPQIHESAGRIIRLLEKTGRFSDSSDSPEFCDNQPETRALLFRAATAGIVMLKNEDNALPLDPTENLNRIAVVGPNAERVVAGGGGSSYIKAPYWTSVLDSVKHKFCNTATEIVFTPGAKVIRYLPVCSATRNPDTSSSGAALDWYIGHSLTDEPPATTHTDDLYFMSFGTVPPEINCDTNFSFRLRVILRPLTSGTHSLSLASIVSAELYLDGQLICQQSGRFEEKGSLFFTSGSEEKVLSLNLIAAAQIASNSDVAIVVVGRDKEWETEGQDVLALNLPGEQERLIRQVAAACKRTIVILQTGTPVEMLSWFDDVQLAAVLSGEVDATGRLPVTYPRRIEECPAFCSWPGENDESCYSEGLFVGYRWWDLLGIRPLFPLGVGLSYNTFNISSGSIHPQILLEGSSVVVISNVKDTSVGVSHVPGQETVLVFFSECLPRSLRRPEKQLCGFGKSRPLTPGEEDDVKIEVDFQAFGMFDLKRDMDSANAVSAWRVTVPKEITWIH